MSLAGIDIIEAHREAMEALCRKYRVSRLELFGSAVEEAFDPKRSDFDSLVYFDAESPMGPFHQYFDFLGDLKALLGRKVDLVEAAAIRNPYFVDAVNATRRLIYAS